MIGQKAFALDYTVCKIKTFKKKQFNKDKHSGKKVLSQNFPLKILFIVKKKRFLNNIYINIHI